MNNNSLWSFLKQYYMPVKFRFMAIFILVPIVALCGQLAPWYVSEIVNLLNAGDISEIAWKNLINTFIFLALVLVGGNILMMLSMYLMQHKLISPLGIKVRKDLFVGVLGLHKNFWSKNSAGNVYAKIDGSRRTTAAWSSIGDTLVFANSALWSLIISLCFIGKIYLPMALVYVIASALLLVFFHKLSANTKQASKQQENMKNKVFGKTTNMISNYLVLKIFGSLSRELKKLGKDYALVAKTMRKNAWIRNKNYMLVDLTVMLFDVAMIIYAIVLWSKGIINVGNVVYLLTVGRGMSMILSHLSGQWMYYRTELFKLQSNLNLLNEKPEFVDAPNAKKLKVKAGEIEFKNLTFSYNHKKPAIDDFSLKIKAGEKIGIVGMSGGGKTTLLHVLQRLVNTPQGSVYIDGQDVALVTQESLHNAVSFIPQDTTLFHRTLSENMSYGTFNASQKEIEDAAKKSFITEFVKDLPQGYKTLVGDKGVKLSGGQRQRVGIARAILKNSKILLLDEATSALDSKSEKFIQSSLQKLIKDKTVIAVAHRLSTLKNMDKIVVMEEGKIIEVGTPKELLDKQGKFAKLWNLQA